jgi:hypothetical protein
MDWAQIAAIFSILALSVEVANSIGIGYGVYWMRNAGRNIVAKISQSLSLNRGTGGSLMDQIKETLGGLKGSDGGNDEPIDLGNLGTFKPSEIKAYANQFLGKAKAGQIEVANPTMNILGKIAQGKSVGWVDAVPALMEMLKQPQGTPNGQEQTSTGRTGYWDS